MGIDACHFVIFKGNSASTPSQFITGIIPTPMLPTTLIISSHLHPNTHQHTHRILIGTINHHKWMCLSQFGHNLFVFIHSLPLPLTDHAGTHCRRVLFKLKIIHSMCVWIYLGDTAWFEHANNKSAWMSHACQHVNKKCSK
jgi:hypothetical protein